MIPHIDYELFGLKLIDATERVARKQEQPETLMPELVALANQQLNINGDTYVAWHISEIANRVLAMLYPAFFDWHEWTDDSDECDDHLRSHDPSVIAPSILLQRVLIGIANFDSNDMIKRSAKRLVDQCPDIGPPPDHPFQDDLPLS